MQFSALRTFAATRFRDTGLVIVDDAAWKNYVNDAYQDMLSRCTWFPWNEAKSTLSYTPSLREQALPLDAWQVLAVWDSTNFMPLVPLEGRIQVYQLYPQQTEIGLAQHYRIFNNKLQLYPLPQATTAIVVEYVQRPADLVADGDLPVFPSIYHGAIVAGAVSLAYRDDGNLQMAGAFQSEYEDEVKRFTTDMMQPRNERYYQPVDDMI